MEVVIVAEPKAGGSVVGQAIAELVRNRPNAVLGLATGSSPEPVYDDLADQRVAGTLSMVSARAFLLDEYVGLPPGHPQSYRAVIERAVVDRLDFPVGAVLGPQGDADELLAECARYDTSIAAAGGVDLQILGIGNDGHIGFNEPVSSLGSRTRLKTLTNRTRRNNARFFGGDTDAVPLHVLTQGVATIMEARHLVMVAWGEGKAAAIAACVEGPLTALCPASMLQMHPHATVVLDEGAASKLRLADYFRETWASKPKWQGL